MILNDIGLRPSLGALQEAVAPLARALYPIEGATLDDHHSFAVQYRAGEVGVTSDCSRTDGDAPVQSEDNTTRTPLRSRVYRLGRNHTKRRIIFDIRCY